MWKTFQGLLVERRKIIILSKILTPVFGNPDK
jgi:hypothetical protein